MTHTTEVVITAATQQFIESIAALGLSDTTEILTAQYKAGLAWPHFSPGWGGLGASRDATRRVREHLSSAGIPTSRAGFVGLHQAATLIHEHASDEHKARFLRRIFTGEDQWCQLFSEPGAGSDLANVATTAVRGDAGWQVNGQKVWTSNARHAKYALLLARTDPDVPKHRGLSLFVLDMSSAGVRVSPLRQADGGARFSEVFLDDVDVPAAFLLGESGQGWALSMHILATERDGASAVFHKPINDLLELWRGNLHAHDSALRDDVTRIWIESNVVWLNAQRQRATQATREAEILASLSKIAASEHMQRYSEVMGSVLGPDAVIHADYDDALAEDANPNSAAAKDFTVLSPHRFLIRTRAMSIEGGTNEISRNLIGERTLGLPGDIRVDKTAAWRDLSRS